MKYKKKLIQLCLLAFFFISSACQQGSKKEAVGSSKDTKTPSSIVDKGGFAAPDWAKNATIYEVNTRQYSEEGTLNAFAKDLDRIKDLGIDIIWFMPIYPISKVKRKGELGSPYSIADYEAVNPELGTINDFKAVVNKIHELGMHVIIDWVPNHTGWDHKWITKHPDWYTQDEDGNIIDPINYETGESWGWTDVADLNYDNKEMRSAMIKAMEFWVQQVDIDGFRVDVAHGVPNDFFSELISTLFKIKPVFLLAEGEVPEHRNSGNFHMSYAWRFKDLMNDIAKGQKNANDIDVYLKEDKKLFKKGYHMYFTSNHDENTWEGTVFERLKDGHKAFAVLAATMDGMPLVYSGQEEPIRRRIKFFDRDPIGFKDYAYTDFYKALLLLKKRNEALWNGSFGGEIRRIMTDKNNEVYAFTREKEGDKVVVILNLSNKPLKVKLLGEDFVGTYTNVFANSTVSLTKDITMSLNPWDYLLLSNK